MTEEIEKKIHEKTIEYSRYNTPKQLTLPAFHDGAIFGYSLAEDEINRLKALIKKAWSLDATQMTWEQFRAVNNF